MTISRSKSGVLHEEAGRSDVSVGSRFDRARRMAAGPPLSDLFDRSVEQRNLGLLSAQLCLLAPEWNRDRRARGGVSSPRIFLGPLASLLDLEISKPAETKTRNCVY